MRKDISDKAREHTLIRAWEVSTVCAKAMREVARGIKFVARRNTRDLIQEKLDEKRH